MKHDANNYEGTGPDAAQQGDATTQHASFSHSEELCGDGTAMSPRYAGHPTHRSGPSSQAERAVMHPEHHDAEWRYYHGAWHS